MPDSASSSDNVLFRTESLNGKTNQYVGNVLIHQPLGYSLTSSVAGIFILLISLFAYLGEYTRKATISGLLTPEQGMLRITAPNAGLLTAVNVTEGKVVNTGDVLFVLSGERLSLGGATQQVIAKQLKHRQALVERNNMIANERISSQKKMTDLRLGAIALELTQFQAEINLLIQREDLARVQLVRQQQLLEAGFISAAQEQQAKSELLSLQGQKKSLQRAKASLDRERTGLFAQQQEANTQHDSHMTEIAGTAALLAQERAENDARSEQISVAPFSGTVTGISVQPGQQVSTNMLYASLIPTNAVLVAHLYAASKQAGFIERGQKVSLRYAAYPYQKFGMATGQVSEIVKSPYAPQELPPHVAASLSPTELYYRIKVNLDVQSIQLYGKLHPLKSGMLVEADVIQEKRRLFEWVLEPIYSISGKM